MQIWLVPGFQESTGQSSFQKFKPLVSWNKFFSWEKNWYRLGKAAAHVLEEVCKRIGYCDRDAERWNDFHYVTVLYKAVKTYVRRLCHAYKNSMKILTGQKLKVVREKKCSLDCTFLPNVA